MNDRERQKRFNAARAERLRAGVRIQRDTSAEIARLLKKASDDIATLLAAQPTSYAQWHLTELQHSVGRALASLEPATDAAIQSGFSRSWQAGQHLIDAPLAAAGVDISGQLIAIDTRRLLAMRSFATDRIRDISLKAANAINSELGLTAIGVQSPYQAAVRVSEHLTTGGMKRANTIVRTQLGSAFSVAGQERQAQAVEIVPGLKKQWRRSGKTHSRYEHDFIDGQIRDIDKPFDLPNGVQLMHPRDPAGPIGEIINCGCSSLPYIENWEVSQRDRVPFSSAETALNRGKRLISDALTEKPLPQ